MKLNHSRILLCAVIGSVLPSIGAAQPARGQSAAPPPASGANTTVSGAVSQFNYDRDGEIEGFLVNDNTLVHLPTREASYVAASIHTGDDVQITGAVRTSMSGVQTIEAQSVHDRTSGKNFTVPQPGAAAPYSGSGRIQQLNYGSDGRINGFVFDNGTLATVPPFAATNPSSIHVGANVAYSGYARNTIGGRIVVDVRTITIDGRQLALEMAPPATGPGGLLRRAGPGAAALPPPPAAAAGTAETPAPPPPPQD